MFIMNTGRNRLKLLPMTLTAAVLVLPGLAMAQTQTDGTPGNPPGTAVGRAVDRATGTPTVPDGTPGNPPGTAAGRLLSTPAPVGMPGMPSAQPGATPTPMPGSTASNFATMPGTAVYERPRLSQIIGARVYNERNESIGEVDDILLNGQIGTSPAGPVAVIQVGGFLGIGGRLMLVPLGDLRWNSERERITLVGATKETLERRPAFEYSATRRG